MDSIYARKSDLDRLASHVDRLVENLNNLVTSKALHELTQNSISEKLGKIEIFIEKSQENIENRLKILEKNDLKQILFKRFFYVQSSAIIALSSVHWKKISEVFLNLMN